jgi:predicted AAA+ superfamily ATPase
MYTREAEKYISRAKSKYRCITIMGPRQSGKTTLSKKLFPNFEYFNFESPDLRSRVLLDPRSFLNSLQSSILDEIQKVPELLSYLQEILDNPSDSRRLILTGSNNLLLHEQISQSMAGRTRIIELFPLQRKELPKKERIDDIYKTLFFGGYPRVFDKRLNPTEWLEDYYRTYVERDVRLLLNIGDLNTFDRFVRLCAGRAGQLISYDSLASDAGISQPTAKSWLSVLQASYICFLLEPHYRNFNKRIIKSPKLYFMDTGLLCYLLRIKSPDQLTSYPLIGSIFENWVISEIKKSFHHNGIEAPIYFWRDQHGHEVDLVIDQGDSLFCMEIKSGQTFQKNFLSSIIWLNKLQNQRSGACIYGGSINFQVDEIMVRTWKDLPDLSS